MMLLEDADGRTRRFGKWEAKWPSAPMPRRTRSKTGRPAAVNWRACGCAAREGRAQETDRQDDECAGATEGVRRTGQVLILFSYDIASVTAGRLPSIPWI